VYLAPEIRYMVIEYMMFIKVGTAGIVKTDGDAVESKKRVQKGLK